jgi:hypothetical protein
MVSSQRDEQRLTSERAHEPDETAATGPDAQQELAIHFARCFGKTSALLYERPSQCERSAAQSETPECSYASAGGRIRQGTKGSLLLGVQYPHLYNRVNYCQIKMELWKCHSFTLKLLIALSC